MNKVPAERLAIAVAQLNPIVGDVSGNLERARIARAEAARDGAVRALFQAQPYEMLKPEHYDLWKEMEITFDPREMIPG